MTAPNTESGTVGIEVLSAESPPAAAAPLPDPKAEVLSDITTRFTYHPPSAEQHATYVRLRDRFRELAENVVLSTPISREQALALTKLEEALMFANAAIARRT